MPPAQIRKVALIHPVRYFEAKQERRRDNKYTERGVIMWPPGWDSIEATGWYASLYFWLGILCLFALGVFEVISHYYGLREGELIEAQREQQRKQQDSEHQSTVSNLEKRLAEAREQLTTVEKFQAQWRLTEEQKEKIHAAIAPFRGQRMEINSVSGDSEGKTYRNDFVQVFDAAGWDHKGDSGIGEAFYAPRNPVGIEITLHPVNEQQVQSNEAINALIKVIGDLKLFDGGGIKPGPNVPAGELDFRVGTKLRQ